MEKENKNKAINLLKGFKGQDYIFGLNVIEKIGPATARLGKSVLIIANNSKYLKSILPEIKENLVNAGLSITGDVVTGSAPNTPGEDVYRIESAILHFKPDCLLAIGGGSTIDAVKAANVLAVLGKYSNDINSYFGTGEVSKALKGTDNKMLPLVAMQTAAGSAAHLTKYSNITDPVKGQKKLIVDEAVIPHLALFDYSVTKTAPVDLTLDGAMDGIAHCLEVFYGAAQENYDLIKNIACLGIELIVENIGHVVNSPCDPEAREALGLGTDLGGYAIMVGGTNGGHLTSFSLVDVTTHGRACAIMNPYYSVFFAPAIEKQLRAVGDIFKRAGYVEENLGDKKGKELGLAVAEGMIKLGKKVGFPTRLEDLSGFSDKHIERALKAAKNPQLDMKLKNMPISLNASLVDDYIEPVLQAAKTGDFDLIKMLDV